MASVAESLDTKDTQGPEGTASDSVSTESTKEVKGSDIKVVYKFCDLQKGLVDAWKEQFKDYIPERVEVSSRHCFLLHCACTWYVI